MKTAEKIHTAGKSLFSYPFKIFFLDNDTAVTNLIISVPKKNHKRAVKRNLIRRRIREAYRLSCSNLENIAGKNILLVYVSSEVFDYGTITKTLTEAISKID